jgi:hypothetical protein
VLDVPHEGQLGETLHDGVVVHDHHGFVLADRWQPLTDSGRQVEAVALPIAR